MGFSLFLGGGLVTSSQEGTRTNGIVLFAQYFWPETIGPAPYCTDLAVWLASRGWSVTVVTSRPHYPTINHYPDWQDGSRDRETYKGRVDHPHLDKGTHGIGFRRSHRERRDLCRQGTRESPGAWTSRPAPSSFLFQACSRYFRQGSWVAGRAHRSRP